MTLEVENVLCSVTWAKMKLKRQPSNGNESLVFTDGAPRWVGSGYTITLAKLSRYYNAETLSDCKICWGTHMIYAHRIILSMKSTWFTRAYCGEIEAWQPLYRLPALGLIC